MLHFIAWAVWISVFIVTVIVTLPNVQMVTLDYYIASVELNVAVLIFIVLSIGMILGMSFNSLRLWRLRCEHHRLKQLHKHTLHEINTLLANPKQDTPH